MPQLIITIVIIVIAAAFCACLEAALFTVSLSTAKVLHEQNKRGSAALLRIKEQMHRSIITLVILNNAVTIVGSIYVGHLSTELYGSAIIGIMSAVLTAVIIIFGEILPKMVGETYAKTIASFFAPFVLFITTLFTPITWFVGLLTKRFKKEDKAISEEELRMLSQMSEAEGSIEHDEGILIQRVFTLNDLTARDIMTPRTVIEALPAGETVHDVRTVLLNKPYSRYPVYQNSIDKIVGVVQTSKMLTALARDEDRELVSSFMTLPIFVPEKKRVDDLMALFLARRKHMAIVQDEFGATTGIVTFEDVLEQLVGEIVDETDEVVDLQMHARDKHARRT
jgi:CBS domain containing-hemolysin-like protein